MFLNFLDELRSAGIPASLKEHLLLLEALDAEVIERTPEDFYYLSRAVYVKDEGLLDKFDQVFAKVFRGLATGTTSGEIPEDWLKSVAEKFLTPEEMAAIKSLGSWDEIMETLKKRLEEQKERHQGGSKWVGTGGTSPYGNGGYNPEGVRIGGESTHKRALKVSASSATWTTPRNSAPATSRWHSAACAASPATALPTNSTSTARSPAPRAKAISTSSCAPSVAMR
jgi:uncharacterized protein with von Willebrand factor type A (vWA) domain